MMNQIPVYHAFEMVRLSTHNLYFGLEIKKPVPNYYIIKCIRIGVCMQQKQIFAQCAAGDTNSNYLTCSYKTE